MYICIITHRERDGHTHVYGTPLGKPALFFVLLKQIERMAPLWFEEIEFNLGPTLQTNSLLEIEFNPGRLHSILAG